MIRASALQCMLNPLRGVSARSAAMTTAPPRWKRNGASLILPQRIGTSSDACLADCGGGSNAA
jgi:hypothetical protein